MDNDVLGASPSGSPQEKARPPLGPPPTGVPRCCPGPLTHSSLQERKQSEASCISKNSQLTLSHSPGSSEYRNIFIVKEVQWLDDSIQHSKRLMLKSPVIMFSHTQRDVFNLKHSDSDNKGKRNYVQLLSEHFCNRSQLKCVPFILVPFACFFKS